MCTSYWKLHNMKGNFASYTVKCPSHQRIVLDSSFVQYTYMYILNTLVNGGWSGWEDATDAECSRSCGTGFKKQVRSCTNPLPQCGGEPCEGSDNRTIACNEQCCPGLLMQM